MNAREEGFLLLSSTLGDPSRRPLTTAQLRTLAARVSVMPQPTQDRDLTAADLMALGYDLDTAARIVKLLDDTQLLHYYLSKAKQADCVPVTRISPEYPVHMRNRLGLDSPGVLWAKGDLSILQMPMIALVGSRDIAPQNRAFAAKVGEEAAKQGFVLVSGNARGADRIAQRACMAAGGRVISVVADELMKQACTEGVLYLSEEGFDCPFTSVRALSRNRVIHALGEKTLVAQSDLGRGGTWSGTVRNLKENWSPVFCFRDGSGAALRLEQLGAVLIVPEELTDLNRLQTKTISFFGKN